MPSILIVDDETSIRSGLKAALNAHDFKISTAQNGQEALDIIKSEDIDLVISDIKMPEMDGMEFLKKSRELIPSLPIILLTAYGSVETAVEAMREGAYDFLTKPINIDKFELLVLRALDNLSINRENERLKSELNKNNRLKDMVGNSKPMKDLFEKVKIVSETKSTVLITGESGTGKELIARAIHDLSPRKDMPFIPVNCAALSENILESELFGHVKGSFTGAVTAKKGRFKAADRGTLFLDEIGELSLSIQVKLLRFLQEKTFEPVGSSESQKVDVRIIAATNRNLEDLVYEGKFREDLFFRLNVVNLNSPPLRERTTDISLLINNFIREFSAELGKNINGISPDAVKILENYSWPGNVRELKNTIENMVLFSRGEIIMPKTIPDKILNPSKGSRKNKKNVLNIEENEKSLLIKALETCRYNKTEAAKKLGMSRRTIHRKIKQYGIEG